MGIVTSGGTTKLGTAIACAQLKSYRQVRYSLCTCVFVHDTLYRLLFRLPLGNFLGSEEWSLPVLTYYL